MQSAFHPSERVQGKKEPHAPRGSAALSSGHNPGLPQGLGDAPQHRAERPPTGFPFHFFFRAASGGLLGHRSAGGSPFPLLKVQVSPEQGPAGPGPYPLQAPEPQPGAPQPPGRVRSPPGSAPRPPGRSRGTGKHHEAGPGRAGETRGDERRPREAPRGQPGEAAAGRWRWRGSGGGGGVRGDPRSPSPASPPR